MNKKPPRPAAPAAHAAHEVRIIGGQWKRSKLPVVDRPGLRPTPSRVRETLFNWLGHNLSGWRCVDAFAGTGALGLEAGSRGAAAVTLVEQDPLLCKSLQGTVLRLKAEGIRVERGDGVAALRQRAGQGLELVFLDPPFADGANEALFGAALQAARQAVGEQGLIYLEAPRSWAEDELAQIGLRAHRQGRAGLVHFHLLQPLRPE
jgi:16S rRNA (guanine966-N2)-methyltransferase